ncbi:hypothetical protein CJF30_00000574 [Rutstroemia sp. NJR-2017a BBW]|nr:hypothetical protein CJF30_00000574 [Rutstroemia sp. NJR-2017a BBW]
MSSSSNTPPDDYFNDLSQSTGNSFLNPRESRALYVERESLNAMVRNQAAQHAQDWGIVALTTPYGESLDPNAAM